MASNEEIAQAKKANESYVDSKAKVFGTAVINYGSYITGQSQVSGIVQESRIVGKSIIQGIVNNCKFKKTHIVEKNESLEDQKN